MVKKIFPYQKCTIHLCQSFLNNENWYLNFNFVLWLLSYIIPHLFTRFNAYSTIHYIHTLKGKPDPPKEPSIFQRSLLFLPNLHSSVKYPKYVCTYVGQFRTSRQHYNYLVYNGCTKQTNEYSWEMAWLGLVYTFSHVLIELPTHLNVYKSLILKDSGTPNDQAFVNVNYEPCLRF